MTSQTSKISNGMTNVKEHTIDASNRALGRVASEAAAVLRGKNRVDFAPNVMPKIKVIVKNIDKAKITGKKLKQKEYKSHSGYPGSLKTKTLGEIIEKKGRQYAFKQIVKGMLPKNRLQSQKIKNLTVN